MKFLKNIDNKNKSFLLFYCIVILILPNQVYSYFTNFSKNNNVFIAVQTVLYVADNKNMNV